ncbi:MAG: hypothetical protein ACPGJS_02435 [Flammeovirgaceae bacterium]
MNILQTIQRFFSQPSFDRQTVQEVLQHFQHKFEKKIKQVEGEKATVIKSLAFQKKQFLILLDKAQFDQQLKALLPYAVKLKKDGQYVTEGQRMLDACYNIIEELTAFADNHENELAQHHQQSYSSNELYKTLFEKMKRYDELTTKHQGLLYGDEKLIKRDLVKRVTALLENPPFQPNSEAAFMQEKKKWIREEVANIIDSI